MPKTWLGQTQYVNCIEFIFGLGDMSLNMFTSCEGLTTSLFTARLILYDNSLVVIIACEMLAK